MNKYSVDKDEDEFEKKANDILKKGKAKTIEDARQKVAADKEEK